MFVEIKILKFAPSKKQIMSNIETIEHEAFVREIHSDYIIVDVLSKSACISCQMKGVCSVSDIEEKEVKVLKEDKNVEKGEKVTVYLSQKLGLRAVLIGYGIPFLIVLTSLIVLTQLTDNELIAGGVSLFLLLPYYTVLYFLKDKISKDYQFRIK